MGVDLLTWEGSQGMKGQGRREGRLRKRPEMPCAHVPAPQQKHNHHIALQARTNNKKENFLDFVSIAIFKHTKLEVIKYKEI